ncbi:MAG TPA: hypothetical protein VN618_04860 [Solirubrobacteraceae bacterium]|nr:hypothetical protein [Solirubrobacteraceae bacterium]
MNTTTEPARGEEEGAAERGPAVVAPGGDGASQRAKRPARPAAARSRGGMLRIALGSAALFAATLILLAERVAAGRDPVLGKPALAQAPRQVLVRKVKRRVIVETTIRSPGRSSGVTSVTGGPVVSGAAPVIEAPLPVTRSS